LLHLRQSAYQPNGLQFRLDERSVAGHFLDQIAAKLRTSEKTAAIGLIW
jgi:hypothetical protein